MAISRENFGIRLSDLINKRGISQTEIAKKIAVTPQAVQAWTSGRAIPRFDKMEALAKALEVDINLLYDRPGLTSNIPAVAPFEARNSEFVYIEMLAFSASCGGGTQTEGSNGELVENQGVKLLAVSQQWFTDNVSRFGPTGFKVATISGDSMSPTLTNGDAAIVDTRDKTFKRDGIYCFELDGDLYIKRIQLIPGGVIVISDNDKYRDYELRGQEFETVLVHGRVVTSLQIKRHE